MIMLNILFIYKLYINTSIDSLHITIKKHYVNANKIFKALDFHSSGLLPYFSHPDAEEKETGANIKVCKVCEDFRR